MKIDTRLGALLVKANEDSLSAWKMTNELLEEKFRLKSELFNEIDISVLRLAQKKAESSSCAFIEILQNVTHP
jgi:hypothetical protein